MTKEQIQEFTLRTSQSNHSGLILVLFDIIRVYMEDALNAYAQDDVDTYFKNIECAKKAHNELMDCINPLDEQGRKILTILRFNLLGYISPMNKREKLIFPNICVCSVCVPMCSEAEN